MEGDPSALRKREREGVGEGKSFPLGTTDASLIDGKQSSKVPSTSDLGTDGPAHVLAPVLPVWPWASYSATLSVSVFYSEGRIRA